MQRTLRYGVHVFRMSSGPLIWKMPIITPYEFLICVLVQKQRQPVTVSASTPAHTLGSSTDLATFTLSQFADARAGGLKAQLRTGHSVGVRSKSLDAAAASTITE